LPAWWIKPRLRGCDFGSFAKQLKDTALEADVSAATTVLAVGRFCEPGCLMLLVDEDGRVAYNSCSPGASLHVPPTWTSTMDRHVLAEGGVVSRAAWGSQEICTVKMPITVGVPARPPRPAKEIRDAILASLGVCGDARLTALRRIGGVVSTANVRATKGEELRSALSGAFLGRDGDLDGFVTHPDFSSFLDATAAELAERDRFKRAPRGQGRA
jgi:hypothetical protein